MANAFIKLRRMVPGKMVGATTVQSYPDINHTTVLIKYISITLFLALSIVTNSKAQNAYGPTTSVRTIIQDRSGNIWLASNEGVIRFDGKLFTNITGTLSSNRFFSVLEDRNGNFWFGNYGSGVYYFNGTSFQHFTTKEGLVNDRVFTMYEDKTGNIWFGTNQGVSCYNPHLNDEVGGKAFQNFTTSNGLSNEDVTAIVEDKTGRIWIGTRGNTFIYDPRPPKGQEAISLFIYEGKTVSNVWSITEDKKGNIWLGGNGLWRYDGKTLTNFRKHTIRYVYEDKKGNIWTSEVNDLRQGFTLYRFDVETLYNANPTRTEIAQSLNLFVIIEVNGGSVWFGAYDGVYRYDGETITNFKSKDRVR